MSRTSPSIYWYDYETFGSDPRQHRAAQFAGLRTDEDLNEQGEPLTLFCRPADDFLPDPVACMVTGITPARAAAEGLPEAEFIRQIHEQFSHPATCVSGYNNIRFDDELSRQLLYRNFYDPYEREYKNGNSRWDILDMLRLCAATRPAGINWPQRDNGEPSFRLEDITRANGIEHGAAHDALADVRATIAVARLLRQAQPKLYRYLYNLRHKQQVLQSMNLQTRQPLLHVSGMYPPRQGCISLVMPLGRHPRYNNQVLVYDLRTSPATWIDDDPESLRARIFSSTSGENSGGIPVKAVHINRCPVIAPPSVLDEQRAKLYGIDLDRCQTHWQTLADDTGATTKLLQAFAGEANETDDTGETDETDNRSENTDPDYMIYSGGFFSDHDKALMEVVRQTAPADLAGLAKQEKQQLPFQDPRLSEMLFRYRARNYPETLGGDEQSKWLAFRRHRLLDDKLWQQYQASREAVLVGLGKETKEDAAAMVKELDDYVESLRASIQ